MITAILAGALAVALAQQTDTTFAVRAGGQLQLEALNGAVTIGTWDRTAMRVRTVRSGRIDVEIRSDGSDVSIETEHRGGAGGAVTFEITVPRNFSIEVEGVRLPITIDGVQGSVALENVEGAMIVRGVTGSVDLESVSGSITLENVRGNVSASSVNEAVSLSGVRGDVDAEAVNGSVIMRAVDARNVSANTVNGLVEYHGTVHDGGNYYLGTHNGRITMSIPEGANARISIETQNGKVEAAFPVQIRRTDDREFDITIGTGSARIELESYNGTVYLVRPSGR
jgi:DUF4097 and DUF4098 domain-containing protein YvlB